MSLKRLQLVGCSTISFWNTLSIKIAFTIPVERWMRKAMNYREFKQEALGKQCRNCINQIYDIQLRRRDCRYWIYPATCRCCNKLQNIVVDIEPSSRWKIWLYKNEK